MLSDGVLTLRELRISDAEALLELLTTTKCRASFRRRRPRWTGSSASSPGPSASALAGRYICFAVVPEGMDTAVGIFQVRQLDPTFSTAEWGFAIGRAFWGSGVFTAAARLTIDFAFETVGIHRLEARAAVANGRGNGALAKLGAVKEAILRRSFPARRQRSRPGALVDRARRLAPGQSRVGRGGRALRTH